MAEKPVIKMIIQKLVVLMMTILVVKNLLMWFIDPTISLPDHGLQFGLFKKHLKLMSTSYLITACQVPLRMRKWCHISLNLIYSARCSVAQLPVTVCSCSSQLRQFTHFLHDWWHFKNSSFTIQSESKISNTCKHGFHPKSVSLWEISVDI